MREVGEAKRGTDWIGNRNAPLTAIDEEDAEDGMSSAAASPPRLTTSGITSEACGGGGCSCCGCTSAVLRVAVLELH